MTNYKVLLHQETYHKAENYLKELQAGRPAGAFLQAKLAGVEFSYVTTDEFIERLMRTKIPRIFANMELYGDGRDWNLDELSILGDISVAMPVTVYDNGRHELPDVHQPPFFAHLVYTPGALLRNDLGIIPADWQEVIRDDRIYLPTFTALYNRRLIPALYYANETAGAAGKHALITIPGLGCGEFAGEFQGRLGEYLNTAIQAILENHASKLTNIKVVYYDPYRECDNDRRQINGITYLVRPLTRGNEQKSQLCKPEVFADPGDDFSDCMLFSIVAWDQVSWPGNDFYVCSRLTDDGVKAAATDTMQVMTGVEGIYDPHSYRYLPPADYRDWREVVHREAVQLQVRDNLIVYSA